MTRINKINSIQSFPDQLVILSNEAYPSVRQGSVLRKSRAQFVPAGTDSSCVRMTIRQHKNNLKLIPQHIPKFLFFLFLCTISFTTLNAQEALRPLGCNPNYFYNDLKKNAAVQKNIQSKTLAVASLTLPFKEDFFYASTESYPRQALWSDSGTYVNTGHAIAPPSIGVATFDGLNKHGYPYQPNLVNMSLTFPADTLTSKPVNLLTVSGQTLLPSDSVALTFYYQARGFGDTPESIDSLLVDFFRPLDNRWDTRVWYSRGNQNANINDTIFKRAFVRIDSTAYLQDGFKFRFRNKATTAGDFDHWHVDYIYLNKNRSIIADTTYDDMAFGYVPTPLLAKYAAMPWEQYIPGEKAAKNSVLIRNNNSALIPNMSYENKMYDPLNVLTYSYTGGAIPELKSFKYSGWSNASPHANPSFNHTFTPFTDSADFKIVHNIYRSGASTDFFPNNDTVIQFQKFRNYYAFDDGSAEAAYYVTGVGSKIVQKITVNAADTLQALRIYFDPVGSLSQVENYTFRINVWNSNGPLPGALIYKDSLIKPKYFKTEFNAGPEYTLTTPQVLSPGDYFIGIQQNGALTPSLGIGFDRNTNHMESLLFDSGNGWTQSTIPGALMMRSVFGKKVPKPVGIPETVSYIESIPSGVFPNPADDMLTIKNNGDIKSSYQLMNMMGQILVENKFEESSHTISTENIAEGVYFLILRSGNSPAQTRKIIIRH